jgi:hypothetical protein
MIDTILVTVLNNNRLFRRNAKDTDSVNVSERKEKRKGADEKKWPGNVNKNASSEKKLFDWKKNASVCE